MPQNMDKTRSVVTIDDERLGLPRSRFLLPDSYTLNADGSITIGPSFNPGTGTLSVTRLLTGLGSAAAPAIAATADSNTGILWPFGGNAGIQIVQDGIVRAYFDSGGHADFSNSAGVKGPAGSAGSPSFTVGVDNNSGRFRVGVNNTGESISSVLVYDWNAARVNFDVPVQMQGYTVATLPAGVQGMRAYVTDATAPVFLGALVGGGAVVTPVFFNGAAWVAG